MPKRHGITASQRTALRQFAQLHPKLRQSQLKDWFEAEFQRTITQPTISESLSDRFKHLDSSVGPSKLQQQQRERPVKWPELDQALFEWQQETEKDIPITGELIKLQATRFWNRLACYQGMQVPQFSNGWLEGYKRRHNIKSRVRYREAASIDEAAIAEQLVQVQAIARQFRPQDVYNCDETGLFWKMTPDRGLATYQVSGIKKDKARITAHFCCNADGSDKLPVWFIGKSARPRCFGAANININALDCVWKSNGKAWMTGEIMIEWLKWFSRWIGNERRVLLVMDNFSGHTLAVDQIQQSNPLPNVTICWLPPNSTAQTQPLDQGIIRTFKAHYRKRWLCYMLDQFNQELNPLRTMNVLKAVRWSIQSWQAVTTESVTNCWKRSGLISSLGCLLDQPSDQAVEQELTQLIVTLQRQDRIQQAMSVNSLLNPEEETVQDQSNNTDLTEQIAQRFDPQPDHESDEEEEVIARIPTSQALHAVQLLQVYEEQQEDCVLHKILVQLEEYEAVMKRRQQQSLQQRGIQSYLT